MGTRRGVNGAPVRPHAPPCALNGRCLGWLAEFALVAGEAGPGTSRRRSVSTSCDTELVLGCAQRCVSGQKHNLSPRSIQAAPARARSTPSQQQMEPLSGA